MVVHTLSSSTLEVEARASETLWVQGQPGLQSKFQYSQDYEEKPCLRILSPPQKKNLQT